MSFKPDFTEGMAYQIRENFMAETGQPQWGIVSLKVLRESEHFLTLEGYRPGDTFRISKSGSWGDGCWYPSRAQAVAEFISGRELEVQHLRRDLLEAEEKLSAARAWAEGVAVS